MDVSLYVNSEANVWYNHNASRNAYEEVFPSQLSKKYSFLCYALARIVDTIVDVALKIFSNDYCELKTKYITYYLTEKTKLLQSQTTHATEVQPPQKEKKTVLAASPLVEPISIEPRKMSYNEEEVVEEIALGHMEDIFEDDVETRERAAKIGFIPGGPSTPFKATKQEG